MVEQIAREVREENAQLEEERRRRRVEEEEEEKADLALAQAEAEAEAREAAQEPGVQKLEDPGALR